MKDRQVEIKRDVKNAKDTIGRKRVHAEKDSLIEYKVSPNEATVKVAPMARKERKM